MRLLTNIARSTISNAVDDSRSSDFDGGQDSAESSDTLPVHLELAPLVREGADAPRARFIEGRIGDYQILKFIASGGMGVIYEARDLVLGRRVAIKFLHVRDKAGAPNGHYQRLLEEARAGARLGHPGFVHVYKFGVVQQGGEARPYLVMEWLPGATLRQVLRREKRPLDLPLWLPRLRALTAAMAWAHERGLLHRDLKPENILVTDQGEIKIIDLGLACLQDAAVSSSLGASGLRRPTPEPVGTLQYMAPEVWRSAAAGPAADVWSLGTILYEVLSGRHPYWRWSMSEEDNVRLLSDCDLPLTLSPFGPNMGPLLGPAMLKVLQSALSKQPSSRYADAQALLCAFDGALRVRNVDASVSGQRITLPSVASPSIPQALWQILTGLRPVLTTIVMTLTLSIPTDARLRQAAPVSIPRSMVYLPGGTFRMGWNDAETQAVAQRCVENKSDCSLSHAERALGERWVTLSPFLLDRHEVTNREFAAWLNVQRGWVSIERGDESVLVKKDGIALIELKQPYSGIEEHGGIYEAVSSREEWPVGKVTWAGAMAYCRWRGGLLPTEAQWEYAAGGLERRQFPWGSEMPSCSQVRFGRNKHGPCWGLPKQPAAVGASPLDVTPEGIFDLGGNLSEWVYDSFYEPYPACSFPYLEPRVDSKGEPTEHEVRVVRGSSYCNPIEWGQSAMRSRWSQNQMPQADIGFRCARPFR